MQSPRLLSLTNGAWRGGAYWTADIVKNTFIHIAPRLPPAPGTSKDDCDIVYGTYHSATKVTEGRTDIPDYTRLHFRHGYG